METNKLIDDFNNSLITNFNLLYTENNRFDPTQQELDFLDEEKKNIDNSFIQFYKQTGSYSLAWQNALGLSEDLQGSVKIISVIKALSDWKEVVYFEDDSPLKHFKILDHFVNEACCGFYTLEAKTASPKLVYYYDFSNEPSSLQLTVNEYIIMMLEAKGFLYWQRVLRDNLRGEESPHTALMKQDLNKVFPEFNFDSFISRFNDLKK
jgi:hypothetical protein